MKKFIVAIVILLVIAFAGYKYLYKDHRNIAEETSEYQVEAVVLVKAFLEQPDEATATYMDKTLTVSGKVTEFESTGITLDNAVYCEFMKAVEKEEVTDGKITVKGRCIGYDELLEIVKLDQCTIIN